MNPRQLSFSYAIERCSLGAETPNVMLGNETDIQH